MWLTGAFVEKVLRTVFIRSGVTRMAVAGSRSSETEGVLVVDGRVRREGIEDTVAVGCGVTRMAVAGFGSSKRRVSLWLTGEFVEKVLRTQLLLGVGSLGWQ